MKALPPHINEGAAAQGNVRLECLGGAASNGKGAATLQNVRLEGLRRAIVDLQHLPQLQQRGELGRHLAVLQVQPVQVQQLPAKNQSVRL